MVPFNLVHLRVLYLIYFMGEIVLVSTKLGKENGDPLPLPNKITELKVKAKSCTCVAIFQAATLNLECYALFPYSHAFLLIAVLHFI